MNDVLPDAVQQGLKSAREASFKRGNRLCVHDGDRVFHIRRFWEDGMALDASCMDQLRGRVEIFDGSRHVYQSLIVGARIEGDECIFDFKWLHPVRSTPAADYAAEDNKPAALITDY